MSPCAHAWGVACGDGAACTKGAPLSRSPEPSHAPQGCSERASITHVRRRGSSSAASGSCRARGASTGVVAAWAAAWAPELPARLPPPRAKSEGWPTCAPHAGIGDCISGGVLLWRGRMRSPQTSILGCHTGASRAVPFEAINMSTALQSCLLRHGKVIV
jgi:hypothetical protein